jgi:tyrosinase
MYLYYFERILRAASGDPNLTLPYWNYSDPNDPNARALPLPFRQPADPVANALFVSQRSATMNGGGQMPPSAVNLTALNDTNFSSLNGSGLSFGGQTVPMPCHGCSPHSDLERTPHDVVHGQVGGPGFPGPNCCWMSSFEFAARDPIFWLHHVNIDRLWEQWLAQGAGRSDPSDPVWLTTQFQFFDENGHSVQLSGQQIVDTAAQLDYIYNDDPWVDGVLQPASQATSNATQPGKRTARRLGSSVLPAAQLGREPVTVSVLVREQEFRLRAQEHAIVLNIEGIEFDKVPGDYYEIYLNLPQGERPDFRSKYYVGNLAFFGIKPRAQRHEGEEQPRQDYNITQIVAKLKSTKEWIAQEAKVTFVRQHVIPPPGISEETEVVPVTIRRVTMTAE